MVKGRLYTPSNDRDGIWYSHGSLSNVTSAKRECDTSTGLMLTAPFNPNTAAYPPQPPEPFIRLSSPDCRLVGAQLTNKFSDHDNRHSFQTKGEYFGDGRITRTLGKRFFSQDLHYTSNDYLKHNGRQPVDYDYDTIYAANYKPLQSASYDGNRGSSGASSTEAANSSNPSYRRFSKSYQTARKHGLRHISNESDNWFHFDIDGKAPSTSLHVLAATQQQQKNWLARKQIHGEPLWKYSYRPPQNNRNPFPRSLDPWWLRVTPSCESGF